MNELRRRETGDRNTDDFNNDPVSRLHFPVSYNLLRHSYSPGKSAVGNLTIFADEGHIALHQVAAENEEGTVMVCVPSALSASSFTVTAWFWTGL